MKTTFSAIGGWLWALLAPVAPCAALCSLLVLVETLSAYARNRRLRALSSKALENQSPNCRDARPVRPNDPQIPAAEAKDARAVRPYNEGPTLSGGQLSGIPDEAAAPLSRLLAEAVATLTRVHIALIVAALLRTAVLDGGDFLTVDVVRLTAGVISLWQIVTILENESIAVPSARRKFLLTLRRFLIKKAKNLANPGGSAL